MAARAADKLSVVAPAQAVMPMPPGMDFDTAAAITLTYGTSHHATEDLAVMRSLAKGLRFSKPEDTGDGYEVIKTLYERKIYPPAEAVRNTIRLLGASNEKIRGLRAEDLIDDRTVRKLEQKGLFK